VERGQWSFIVKEKNLCVFKKNSGVSQGNIANCSVFRSVGLVVGIFLVKKENGRTRHLKE
jgi:hypothetical protein